MSRRRDSRGRTFCHILSARRRRTAAAAAWLQSNDSLGERAARGLAFRTLKHHRYQIFCEQYKYFGSIVRAEES